MLDVCAGRKSGYIAYKQTNGSRECRALASNTPRIVPGGMLTLRSGIESCVHCVSALSVNVRALNSLPHVSAMIVE